MLHLFGTIIILLSITFNSGPLYADQLGENRALPPVRNIPETTNIHYTGEYCDECHFKGPEAGSRAYLKYNNDFTQLCSCHYSIPLKLHHTADIYPTEEKKAKIPSDLPLYKGEITCITCHDIHLQCEDNPELKRINKKFIRGAPYRSRTDLCFRCHDEEKYKKLNPHNQLDENGNVVITKCLYCHVEKPEEIIVPFKLRGRHFSTVKFIGNLDMLCIRCHYVLNHPVNVYHLLKPSVTTLATIRGTERKLGVVLPLNQQGKITCSTCHNPHEQGVIPDKNPASAGAGEKKRARIPVSKDLCLACHDMNQMD